MDFKRKRKTESGSSESSKISTSYMKGVLEKLLLTQNRASTRKTYFRIWRQFNSFVISLDDKLNSWEECVTLFVRYLINKGMQSSSIKTYVSAIKKVLTEDGYEWDQTIILLTSLTHECRLCND